MSLRSRRRATGPAKDRGIVANTLFGLVAQATTAACTTVLTLYLVRQLGPDDYGLFSLTLSISAVVLMFSDFGLASSAGVSVAEHVDDPVEVRRITNAGLRLKLIGALGVAILLFALAPVIAHVYNRHGLTGPLRWGAVSLVFESLLMLYTSTFGAMRRVALNARTIFLESITEMTASIALVATGAGVGGAVAGRAVGYGTGALIGAAILYRIVGRPHHVLRSEDHALTRKIIDYAKPLMLINGAYTLYAYVDALLIGALLTTRDVGEFTAPLRLVTLIGYIGQSVATAVSPRLAGKTPDVKGFVVSLRVLIVLQILLMVPLLAWSEPIVDLLLGKDYTLAGRVLRGLVPYAFLFGLGPLITMTVTFLGGARQRVPITFAALGINLVIDLVLLPTIGVMGATIGTGVAFAIYVPAHLRVAIQSLDLDLRPVWLSLLRTLIAGAAATGCLLVVGTGSLTLTEWIGGGAAAVIMYVSVLIVLGELKRDEMVALARYVRGG